MFPVSRCASISIAMSLASLFATKASAQDRLKTYPGYERYMKLRPLIATSIKRGVATVTWRDDGKLAEYEFGGKRYLFDFLTGATKTLAGGLQEESGLTSTEDKENGPNPFQARGRQSITETSANGLMTATYKDRNIILKEIGAPTVQITTDGSEKDRIKNGTASWVYGEELAQRSAMWWSPDSKKLAYYRFDESKVPDYFLQMKQTQLYSDGAIEAYPKVGKPNPVVDLLVYDVKTKKTTRIDVRDGKPSDTTSIGHYVYGIRWTPEGKELMFYRANRKQNIVEIVAADPESGSCRVVVHEEWPASWVENSPSIRFFEDGKRFILTSERNGYHNYYLYDISGKLINPITKNNFEVASIIRIDESKGLLYYMGRDGDNHMKLQLHRVSLDGTNDIRLTDPAYSHIVNIAPDGLHFSDVAQTHDIPQSTRLVDASGKVITIIATSDLSTFDKLGFQKAEVFSYQSVDGKETCYGVLNKPSNFDPTKKYPVIVTVYGGPRTSSVRESFVTPNALTELGFLVASFDGRNSDGRGKKFSDQLYMHLGGPEIDDQAQGVKELAKRPYVDAKHVGIAGTSYGGYASAMCLLRYPDVFSAACASSPVTSWIHYDTIYTERYMWIPAENTVGYEFGSAMTYARDLKGRLMIYYGTADDNVHPNNSMQLIFALQRAGKNFEVQLGPDQGHSSINQDRMLEFFIENLVVPTPSQR